jgi:dGTPase
MNVAESLACNYTRSKNFLELYKGKEQQGNEVAQHIRAILKAASLLHDIGNPPFGHFGEVAIRDYFKKLFETKMVENSQIILDDSEKLDFTEFDGNAQGLRIITKLQYLGTIDGLNLTYGTLGAYMKYPNEGKKEDEKEYIGNHKHGVFKTEQVLFHKIVENCNMSNADGTIKRHPLAFLVEAADTICYGTMDVEDGLYQNWYNVPDLLKDINDFIYKNAAKPQKICDIIGFNYDNESDKKEDPRAIHLKLREHLITYLVDLCIRNFNDNIEKIDKGEYGKRGEELVYDDPNCVARALKDFTQRKILSNRNVLKFEITGNSVITGLLDILIKYFFHKEKSYHSRLNGIISDSRMAVVMKENLAIEYPESKVISSDETNSFDVGRLNQYAKFRMIVDFVSSMTDKYSVELYQTLSGNSL